MQVKFVEFKRRLFVSRDGYHGSSSSILIEICIFYVFICPSSSVDFDVFQRDCRSLNCLGYAWMCAALCKSSVLNDSLCT